MPAPGQEHTRIRFDDLGGGSSSSGCLVLITKFWLWGTGLLIFFWLAAMFGDNGGALLVLLLVAGGLGWTFRRQLLEALKQNTGKQLAVRHIQNAPDPLAAASSLVQREGGLYLCFDSKGDQVMSAHPRRHVLVLGPSQSGKTSSVIVPSISLYNGPVVVTSTKPDVIYASAVARKRRGRLWLWDPSGKVDVPPEIERLRWSPLQGATQWDDAWDTANAMIRASNQGQAALADDGSRTGGGSEVHFANQARDLIAVLLYAATRNGSDRSLHDVLSWINQQDFEEPARRLQIAADYEDDYEALTALEWLVAHRAIPERERGSIVTTVQNFLRSAYGTQAVLRSSIDPTFDGDRFVNSSDTIYCVVPPRSQDRLAPLLVGLIQSVRHAASVWASKAEVGASSRLPHTFLALDEAANIAPIYDLDKVASEGIGQGIRAMVCLQDMSQARSRWGENKGQGFLSLFQDRLIFSGIVDPQTINPISEAIGDTVVLRKDVGYSDTSSWRDRSTSKTETYRQDYERDLKPQDISAFDSDFIMLWRPEGYLFGRKPMWRPDVQQQPWDAVARGLEAGPTGPVPVATQSTGSPYQQRQPQ